MNIQLWSAIIVSPWNGKRYLRIWRETLLPFSHWVCHLLVADELFNCFYIRFRNNCKSENFKVLKNYICGKHCFIYPFIYYVSKTDCWWKNLSSLPQAPEGRATNKIRKVFCITSLWVQFNFEWRTLENKLENQKKQQNKLF